MELRITYERHDRLASFDSILNEVALPEVAAVCEQGTAMAQGRASTDLGFYRNSITNQVTQPQPGVIEGSVFSTDNPIKVEAIEKGRKPGTYAPVSLIQAWVARKLGVVNIRDTAFKVNRKIFLKGISGKFVFRETFREMQPLITRMGENVAAKVASRI